MKDDANTMRQIARFLANEMTAAERVSFNDWLNEDQTNRKFFEESKVIWELTELPTEEPLPIDIDASWDKFEAKLPIDKTKELKIETRSTKTPIMRQLLRIAAVFLIGWVGWYWWSEPIPQVLEKLSIHTTNGEKKEILLPDGSKVWLNENTRIEYAETFHPRILTLEGEAFFEVTKRDGQTFEIETRTTQTKVLGTSFNLRAYPNEAAVELVVNSGKVAFQEDKPTKQALVLNAGDAGIFDRKTQQMSKKLVEDKNAMAWKTGVLVFENERLEKVLPILERYFGVEIKTSNQQIANCHLTGKYEQPKLDHILNVLSFSLNLEVENNTDAFVLLGAGCEAN